MSQSNNDSKATWSSGSGAVGVCYSSSLGGGSCRSWREGEGWKSNTDRMGVNGSNIGDTRVLSDENKRQIEEVWGRDMIEEANKRRK